MIKFKKQLINDSLNPTKIIYKNNVVVIKKTGSVLIFVMK